MEGDKTADNEKELTSTSSSAMEQQLLSTNNEEKSDSNDTLPTSSTDASTSIKSSHLVSDDPISSTSEMDPSKSKSAEKPSSSDVDKGVNCFDTDVELFGMSISTERSEAIEENVDDLVNDLETLLGESTDDFNVPKKSPKSAASATQEESCETATEKVDTTVSSEKANEEISKEPMDVVQEAETEQAETVEELVKDTTQSCSILVDSKSAAKQEAEVCEQKAKQDATSGSTPEAPQEEADQPPQAIAAETEGSELSSPKDPQETPVVVSSSHSPLLQSTDQEFPKEEEVPVHAKGKEERVATEILSALTITESAEKEPIKINAEEQEEEIPENVNEEKINPPDPEPVDIGIVVEEVALKPQVSGQGFTEENKQKASAPAAPEATNLNVQEPMQVDEEVKTSEESSEPGPEEIACPALNTDMSSSNKPKETPEIQAEIIEPPTDVEMVSTEEAKAFELLTDIEMVSTEEPKETIELSTDTEMVSVEKPKEIIEVVSAGDANEITELPTDQETISAEEPKETIDIVSAGEPKEITKLPTDIEAVSTEDPKETTEMVSAGEYKETTELPTDIETISAEEAKETIEIVSAGEPKKIAKLPTDMEAVSTEEHKETTKMVSAGEYKETTELPTDIVTVSAEEPKKTIELVSTGEAKEITELPTDIETVSAEEPKETTEVVSAGEHKETINLSTDMETVSAEEPKEAIEIVSAEEPKEIAKLPTDIEAVSTEEPKEATEPQTNPVVAEMPTAIQTSDETSADAVQPESDCQNLKQANEDELQSDETVLEPTEDALQAEENQIQPKISETQSAPNLPHPAEGVLDAQDVPRLVEEAAIASAISPEEKPVIEPTEETEEIKESMTQERFNQPQGECETLRTSAASLKEIVEIEELTEDLENAEIVDIPAIVEEPEDEVPVGRDPKVNEEDNIVEVTNEQITEEHLEEIPAEPEVASSDQKLPLAGETTDSVVSEVDAVDTTEPDVIISTEEISQVAQVAKVKEVVRAETMEVLEPLDEQAEELPSDNVIAEEATIVKTEELPVVDKTVSDEITKPVEHEDGITEQNTQTIETAKAKSEIMIRRKTVEQDLEKVVCLSEESSDSDCTGLTSDKPMQDLPALEDANLIKGAPEVEQFSDPELPIEESIPVEDNVLARAHGDVESINATSNLETLLAVASLQNESVADTREHRRLSENEIREMEAIRMAVASITDSSQDTYDSFMVENQVTEDISNLPEAFIAEDTNIEEIGKSSEDAACATELLPQSSGKVVEETENKSPDLVNTDELGTSSIDNNSQSDKDNIPEDSSSGAEAVKDVLEVAKEQTFLLAKVEKPCVASSTCKSPNPAVGIPEKDTVKELEARVQVLEAPVVVDAATNEETPAHKPIEIEKPVAAEIASKTPSENNIIAADSANSSAVKLLEEKPPRNRSKRSSKISEPLTINVEEVEKKEKVYSPKITIKPLKVPDEEVSTTSEADASKGSLKMTITKQSDKMHSILKLYNPEDEHDMLPQAQEEPIPKLIIKPKLQQVEQHSPKMTTRSAKVCSPTSTRCSSPRITIKPVPKPAEVKLDVLSPLKITIKPVVKPEDASRKHSPKTVKDADQQKNHNLKITIKPIPRPIESPQEDLRPSTPKLIIKPIPKPAEACLAKEEPAVCTPKLTIRPLKRHLEETDLDNEPERSSPKITIKPLVKPAEHDSTHQSIQTTPKIKIRPVRKHEDCDLSSEVDREEVSPKISIKPLLKPPDLEVDDDEEVKERIVLKINKGNLPLNKESKKREHPDEDKGEKVGIKLKFSTTGGHTHIVQEKEDSSKRQRKDSGYLSSAAKKELEENPHKRPIEDKLPEKSKRLRSALTPDNLAESGALDKLDPNIPSQLPGISQDRSQLSKNAHHSETPDISKIAALAAQTTHIEAPSVVTVGIATPTVTPGPKKRGRPRKIPLKFREDLDATISSPITPQTTPSSGSSTPVGNESLIMEPTSSGGRPKRSCRGQNVMATLGIKPRKPRGRGRGSKVNMGDRGTPTPAQVPVEITAEVPAKPDKAERGAKAKLKFGRKSSEKEIVSQDTEAKAKEPAKSTQEPVGKEVGGFIKSAVGSSHVTIRESNQEAKTAAVTPENSFEDSLKRKGEDFEDHASKKRKDDKTPNKKLEATTRRQKAQLQRKSEEFSPIDIAPSSSQPTHSPEVVLPPVPNKQPLTDQEQFVELNSKNYPDITITKSKSLPDPIERPVEVSVERPEERLSVDSNSKKDSALDEDDDEDLGQDAEIIEIGDDSESERQREHVLQKKQEAIKKCRAKRMEKLARAAELKRKRQEQAAQQREARKAAEEAERVATEKARATKRYGRYGVPKPQISLVDAPVQESAGPVKSHVAESPTKPANEPASVEDKADKEPLKSLEEHLTPNKSPEKLLFSEPMVVDPPEESPAKIRRSLAREDVIMVDEDTRMSADFRGSRSQTPAKQSAQPADILVEDSQGSIGTEGGKSRSSKAPKMEVFQDLESSAYAADQLAEYSWNGQGPFMIQEQVTQYLGIKSFKRKYPNMTRRAVDIQERDYLKESGQVTEGQCDLGLTAVAAQDILDIMYADFQDKYEDYCKAQREKQARELANKQKALNQFTLKPGFDKLDILEQAVQSAAAWNSQFNKARREQRRAHMDLQNWSIHYPKSKMKILPSPKIGHYPIALVPGQFTDYYRDYTPTELNNLPLNTMCYDEIKITRPPAESEDSSNGSDSDSESSSGSSSSGSSCDDANCKQCDKKVKKTKQVRETDSDDVVFVENDASSSDSVVLVSVTSAPVTA